MTTPLWLILGFALVGVLDTSYLIYHRLTGTEVACWFFPKAWCYKVQHSKQSKTFGIPNAYLGFLMYAAIIASILLVQADWFRTYLETKLLIAAGFGFSMYFVYVQAFVLKAFCTWCVLSAINFTAMLVTSFYI
ncbi:vitamin K epoxide reductase family protein [Candidatus Microgenomates bacterium]|nr:vitamin K epoxide reductase family protein [Candidatus Microgenomates bacterium]